MANPTLDLKTVWETIELERKHGGNVAAMAREAGKARSTMQNRIHAARLAVAKGQITEEGLVPGFDVKKLTTKEDEDGNVTARHITQGPARDQAEDPEGMQLKGLSQYVAGGEIVGEWRKWDKGKIDPVEVAKQIAESFDGMKVKKPRIDVPQHNVKDQLALYPVSDWHLGLMTWGKETVEDWDLDKSVKAIRETMAEIVARTQVADTAILLSVGDLIHSDNNRNMTAKSGNILDVDGRYQKIIHATCALMADVALMALQKHKKLIIRILPGNHDEHSCVAVTYFLSAFFKDDKRVTVDLDPSPFFVYPFGDNLIVSTHGHTIKPEKLQTFVSSNYRDLWGKAKHCYGFVGHLHHVKRIADEVSGMVIEQLPAPIPPDAWHFGAGYISGRAIASFSFHAKDGLVSRLNQTMRTGK